MLMEAGAPAVPVAEVATEVNAVPDQRRWATAWWKYCNTSIWNDSALGHRQLAETCWGQGSPMPADAARSLRRIIANCATPRCFGCGLSCFRTLHTRHAATCKPTPADDEARTGAMLAGLGCG